MFWAGRRAIHWVMCGRRPLARVFYVDAALVGCAAATAGTAIDVPYYLMGAAGTGLASVAAESQVATNGRGLAQEALPRAWMIGSLVRAQASRSALRHLRRGGERDAGIFVGDDGGRGIARGDIRARDRRHLARSRSRVDHGYQLELEPDRSRQHGDVHQQRRPHVADDLGQYIDQHDAVHVWSASLFIYPRRLDSLHYCWRWHRQRFFECPEFLRGARNDAVLHQW
jgi:hypothetical protein